METDQKSIKLLNTLIGILRDINASPLLGASVLDLGCGRGGLLRQLLKQGYLAYGTDLVSYGYQVDPDLNPYFRPIHENPYSLPFDKSSFDFCFTNQVVEHVNNTDAFFSEISRVLKPGGISINIFPSKYRFIEPHVKVPLAGVFNSLGYFYVWALLGIGKANHSRSDSLIIAKDNWDYIRTKTNYLSRKKLTAILNPHFQHIDWLNDSLIKHGHGRANLQLKTIAKHLPFVGYVYGSMHACVLCVKK